MIFNCWIFLSIPVFRALLLVFKTSLAALESNLITFSALVPFDACISGTQMRKDRGIGVDHAIDHGWRKESDISHNCCDASFSSCGNLNLNIIRVTGEYPKPFSSHRVQHSILSTAHCPRRLGALKSTFYARKSVDWSFMDYRVFEEEETCVLFSICGFTLLHVFIHSFYYFVLHGCWRNFIFLS